MTKQKMTKEEKRKIEKSAQKDTQKELSKLEKIVFGMWKNKIFCAATTYGGICLAGYGMVKGNIAAMMEGLFSTSMGCSGYLFRNYLDEYN